MQKTICAKDGKTEFTSPTWHCGSFPCRMAVLASARGQDGTYIRLGFGLSFHASCEQFLKGFALTGTSYNAGTVFLLRDKGEKKSSGSYYTPNNIVDYVVENTIGPLCEKIDRELRFDISTLEARLQSTSDTNRAELENQLNHLKEQFAERVLKIRILDPAMGSGHFLIRACQYVAEQIATNPHTHDTMADDLQGDESVLTHWKRRVAETCLYGVDRNFMAVELAKLALWLETIATSLPLTFLDHHLRRAEPYPC